MSETERIEQMVRDGKISTEEAAKLRAALAGEAGARPAPLADERIRPARLSRCAIAGALGPVGAVVVGLVAFGIGSVSGATEDAALAGALSLGGATFLAGIVLSVVALVAMRMQPGEVRGRGLAVAGIVVPVVCVAAVSVAGAALARIRAGQARQEEKRAREAVEDARRQALARKADGFVALAEGELAAGRHVESLKLCEEALSLSPDDSRARALRDRARAQQRAVEVARRRAEAMAEVRALMAAQDLQKALAVATELVRQDDSPEIQALVAEIRRQIDEAKAKQTKAAQPDGF